MSHQGVSDMKLLVTLQGHFYQVKGKVYSHHLTYDRFASRYLEVFDELLICARLHQLDQVPADMGQANGPGVQFHPIPNFHGPWQYLKQRSLLKRAVRSAVQQCDAYCFRMAGQLGIMAWRQLQPGVPFGVEVVADPWLVFAPGSIKSLVRPIVRQRWQRALQQQCLKAAAVSYVTEHTLQDYYPAHDHAVTTHYSSIELDDRHICTDPSARLARIDQLDHETIKVGFVGSLSQGHKLPQIHLQAVAACIQQGLNLHFHIIGDGNRMQAMQALSQSLGIANQVTFHGRLPGGQAVLEAMDSFDLMLNATAAEGLPRVVIEAMSRGCPCIASDVGGTSELLEERFLVPPFDAKALAQHIQSLLSNHRVMKQAVQRNLTVAHAYKRSVLQERRRLFYQALRDNTEATQCH